MNSIPHGCTERRRSIPVEWSGGVDADRVLSRAWGGMVVVVSASHSFG